MSRKKSDYYLAIDFDPGTLAKLMRLAKKSDRDEVAWIMDKINSCADVELQDYCSFLANYPRVYKQLRYWTGKRLGYPTLTNDSYLNNEVHNLVENIICADSELDLRISLLYSGGYSEKLSRQEKAIIAKFFPFSITNRRDLVSLDWFKNLNWYHFEDGEYFIFEEPTLEEILYQNQQIGLITRNKYEATILNSSELCIVDVDFSEVCEQKTAISLLTAYQAEHPTLSFRVYRTKAGLRYLCTSNPLPPDSSLEMMGQLMADPTYVKLCQFQNTYRARLSPKPWRVDDDLDETRVCELIETVGDGRIDERFVKTVEYHDRSTRALSNDKELYFA